MATILTKSGCTTRIGVWRFPDRKRPCLCIEKGNEVTIYGTFTSENAARLFMKELGEFLDAEFTEN